MQSRKQQSKEKPIELSIFRVTKGKIETATPVILKSIFSFLDIHSQQRFTVCNKQFHKFFKDTSSSFALLQILKHYKIPELENCEERDERYDEIKSQDSALMNPILNTINKILQANPMSGLEKIPFNDDVIKERMCSPLQFAYYTQNFYVCGLILKYIESMPHGKQIAEKQIRQIDSKGHSVIFDLIDLITTQQSFIEQYLIGVPVLSHAQWDSHLMEIGKAQARFPRWIAQIWCDDNPFATLPNFIKAMEQICFVTIGEPFYQDFFDFDPCILGRNSAVYKKENGDLRIYRSSDIQPSQANIDKIIIAVQRNLVAMVELKQLISSEINKFRQKLLEISDQYHNKSCVTM